jgi:hypothetical protein
MWSLCYFLSLCQNTWEKQLRGGRIYFGSYFEKFWSVVPWLCCSGTVLSQNIMAGSIWRTETRDNIYPSEACPPSPTRWPTSSNKAPPLNGSFGYEYLWASHLSKVHWLANKPVFFFFEVLLTLFFRGVSGFFNQKYRHQDASSLLWSLLNGLMTKCGLLTSTASSSFWASLSNDSLCNLRKQKNLFVPELFPHSLLLSLLNIVKQWKKKKTC